MSLLTTPPKDIEVRIMECYEKSYCLVEKRYKSSPKKVTQADGSKITRAIPAIEISIFCRNQGTVYTQYDSVIKEWLKINTDPVDYRAYAPKVGQKKVPKPECIEKIKAIDDAREKLNKQISQMADEFEKQIQALGGYVDIPYQGVRKDAPGYSYDDSWFTLETDDSNCQMHIRVHEETALGKAIKQATAEKKFSSNVQNLLSNDTEDKCCSVCKK